MKDNKITNQHDFTFEHNGKDVYVSIKSYEEPIKETESQGEMYSLIEVKSGDKTNSFGVNNPFLKRDFDRLEEEIKAGIDKLLQ